MKDLKNFDISFIGLKDGVHQFDYNISKEFFDFFNYEEFYNSNVNVSLSFLKKPTLFELNFEFSGSLEVACDITNELFQQPIATNIFLIVKFGDEFNNENDELLIIPHSDFKLNIAQYIYEAIVLEVPIKRVHPGVEDGTLKSEILDKLNEFKIKDLNKEENHLEVDSNNIDPRWNKLKSILIEKNKSNGTS
ncbi:MULTISPECIES: YceD family protein [Flavobacteriaceae]|uniref:DUF177 domain-containing protein n=2 Tax=Flavobacteriaceae TaxID=49546 RepID=A0A4Y8ASP4_9FLAO|nr:MULTISPECIES: DUF177 domain-containing protein [Flavobacteriaceae]TEW74899.1 DUF177 domain-containing protein [Gramella jeungdoensis]GGK43203.1 hypothetical protein GCM10007963_09100 [Lutibacter litoralis]